MLIDRTLHEKRVHKALERLLFLGVALLIILGAVNLIGCNGEPTPPPPDNSFDCDNIQGSNDILAVDEPVDGRQFIVTFTEDATEMEKFGVVSALTPQIEALGAPPLKYFEATGQAMFVLPANGPGALSIMGQPLNENPAVLFIEQDGLKYIPEEQDAAAVESWGLDRVDQRDLPLDDNFNPSGTGADIDVYVLDTGVDYGHPDFAGRTGDCFDAFGSNCDDDHGHGTHVSGTVLGTTYGVAKEAMLHSVRVLQNGSGSDSSVIAGINWATDHCVSNGLNCVGNMSLGGGTSNSLDTALCRSINAGVAWAVAAGNSDSNACNGSPNRVRQALTTVASTKSDDKASFSSHGPCTDIIAPGYNIISARRGGGSTSMSGTSMASPHVAGGLVLCAEAGADPRDCVLANATPDKIDGLEAGTPNLLLYVGQ